MNKQFPKISQLLEFKIDENSLLSSFNEETLLSYKNNNWDSIEESLMDVFAFIEMYEYSLCKHGTIQLVTGKEIGYTDSNVIGLIFKFHSPNFAHIWEKDIHKDWLDNFKCENNSFVNKESIVEFVNNNKSNGIVPIWFADLLIDNFNLDSHIDNFIVPFINLFTLTNNEIGQMENDNYSSYSVLDVLTNHFEYISFALNDEQKNDLNDIINKVKKGKVLLLKKYENIQGQDKNVKQVFNDFEEFIMKTTENKSLDRQEVFQKIMQYLQGITPLDSIYAFDVFNKVANSEFFSDFHVEMYDEKIVLSVKTNVKQSLLLLINQYKQVFDNKVMSPDHLFSKAALLVFENEISNLLDNTQNVDFAITIKANNQITIEMNENHKKITLFNVAKKLSDLRLAKPNKLFNPKKLDCKELIDDWNTKFVKSYQFQCANFFEQKDNLTLFDVLFMLSFVDMADTNNYSLMRLNDNFDDPVLRYYGFAFQAEHISNKTKQSTLRIIKNMATDLNILALKALKKVPVKFDRYQQIFDPLLQSTSTQSVFIINQNAVNSVQVYMLDKIVPLPFILNIEFN